MEKYKEVKDFLLKQDDAICVSRKGLKLKTIGQNLLRKDYELIHFNVFEDEVPYNFVSFFADYVLVSLDGEKENPIIDDLEVSEK